MDVEIIMSLETDTVYSRNLINEAAWVYWRKTFASTFIISLIGMCLALVLIFHFDSKSWISGSFLALSTIASLMFFWAYFIYRNRSLAIFEQMGTPIASWSFTEEKLSVESDTGKSEFKWSLLKGIIKSNNVWLLVFKNNAYSVFPISDVSNEILTFLSNKILDNGGEISK